MESGRMKANAIPGIEDFEFFLKNYSSYISLGVGWDYSAQWGPHGLYTLGFSSSQWKRIWEKIKAALKAQHLLFPSPLSISWLPFDSRARYNPCYTTYWLSANLCDFSFCHMLSGSIHPYLLYFVCCCHLVITRVQVFWDPMDYSPSDSSVHRIV